MITRTERHRLSYQDHGPNITVAVRAKLFASEAAIKLVNDALQMFGNRGYGDQEPLERMYRNVRKFTVGGGTAQELRTQVANGLPAIKAPQTWEGYAGAVRPGAPARVAA